MNALAWLNPYRWLLVGGVAAAIALGVPILWHRHNAAQQGIGYDRRAAEDKAAAEAQTARNRDLQRQAELRYVVQAEARDHYFTTTVREIVHDAAPLAACPPLPEPLRLRINAAIECAGANPTPTCGADGPLPGTGEAARRGNGQ